MRTKMILILLAVMGAITICCKNTNDVKVEREVVETVDTVMVVDTVDMVEVTDTLTVVE